MTVAIVASRLLAGTIWIAAATQAVGEPLCAPTLAFKDVRLTDALQAPGAGRLWFAVVSVDASGCAADAKGSFEIVFSRLKENAPEMQFREEFVWASPSVEVGLHFSPDEAVERYWFEHVEPCACPLEGHREQGEPR